MNMATLNCAVIKGDTPIEIFWKFNNRKISSNDGVLITRSGQRISVLSIESVRSRHAGNYTCVGKNPAGIMEYSSELKVNGKRLLMVSAYTNGIYLFIFLFLYQFSSHSIKP